MAEKRMTETETKVRRSQTAKRSEARHSEARRSNAKTEKPDRKHGKEKSGAEKSAPAAPDKEGSAPEKKSNKERLKEITDSIENGIKELFNSEKYKQYLQTMSRFHRYSVNNQMLIHMQKPNATLVAGFNKWRDQFGRNVMKGEKGIKIIAPTPFKKKIEETKLDPDTKLPMLDENGNEIRVEKEIQIPMFRVVSVFDVSQTRGKPLPQLASDLTGNVRNYDAFLEAIKRSSIVPVEFKPIGSADGYFSLDEQKIVIREGMSEVQTVSALFHEMAHSKLHNYKDSKQTEQNNEEQAADEQSKEKYGRRTEEVQAESISFAVCAYYGIKTEENSFGYIAAWSKDKDLSELRSSLEVINKTANDMINTVDKNYAEVRKERGLDPLVLDDISEKAFSQTSIDVPDPTITQADMHSYGYTYDDMLPVSKDIARKLYELDAAVYILHYDDTESMVLDASEFNGSNDLYGIEKADWDRVKDKFHEQEDKSKDRGSLDETEKMSDNISAETGRSMADIEADVKAGKSISLSELAGAMEKERKADKAIKSEKSSGKKPSLVAKLTRPLPPKQDKTQTKSKEREM